MAGEIAKDPGKRLTRPGDPGYVQEEELTALQLRSPIEHHVDRFGFRIGCRHLHQESQSVRVTANVAGPGMRNKG
jgi:hypothetical protein